MSAWAARAVYLVFLVTASGCLSPRDEAPALHTYQLSLDALSSEARLSETGGPVLLVSPALAQPGFDTPRMTYLKRPYELEYYAVNQWADTPAHLFTPLLVQALDRTGLWRAVVSLPSSVRGDFRLDSSGFSVQQEFLQQPSLVRVALRAQLADLKEFRVVSTKTFETVEAAPSEDAYGGVLAANRAAATLLDHVASWLQACMRHAPECRP